MTQLVVLASFVLILLILGEVCCQRRRHLEIRRPRRDPLVREEDKHKYIYNGKEYSRPPNLFDVGGELKLLPEVVSNLNFEPREFMDHGSPTEQKELRDSRPWGRVYVDGWPAPIQYMRSHFGGPAVEGMQMMVLADPPDACEPLRNTSGSPESSVVIATRGKCTFATKARNAQEAMASSLLIVNNEPGLLHPPGPDGKNLDIFSAMVPRAEGRALMNAMSEEERTQGILVPMNCHERSSGLGEKNQLCHPATKGDRDLIDNLALGGFLTMPGGETFEYLLAEFGAKVPSRELVLASTEPTDGCVSPVDPGPAVGVKAVLVSRGTCSFIDKAEALVTGGVVGAMIVVNNETSLFHMGASPRWRGASIPFPTLLVTDLAGRAISSLPPGSRVRLDASNDARASAWEEINDFREASSRPEGRTELRSLYETLMRRSEGFMDRLSAIQSSFDTAQTIEGGREEDKETAALEHPPGVENFNEDPVADYSKCRVLTIPLLGAHEHPADPTAFGLAVDMARSSPPFRLREFPPDASPSSSVATSIKSLHIQPPACDMVHRLRQHDLRPWGID